MHRVCFILASLVVATPARADFSQPYVAPFASLGFSGDADLHTDGFRIGGAGLTLPTGASDFSPESSVGGGILYMHPVLPFLSLGGRFLLSSWRTDSEGSGGRNLAFDLAVVPQLRLQLSAALELYLSVPVGLTMNVLQEFDQTASLNLASLNASASLASDIGSGWNLATLAGVRFALSKGFGLLAEIGYAWHAVSHDVRFRVGVAGASGEAAADIDVSWSQIALDVGVFF